MSYTPVMPKKTAEELRLLVWGRLKQHAAWRDVPLANISVEARPGKMPTWVVGYRFDPMPVALAEANAIVAELQGTYDIMT